MRYLLLIIFSSLSFALNLSILDYDNPSATHILDAEVIDDLLIVVGMIGGIEFYDISNPQLLNHLTTLTYLTALVVPSCVKLICFSISAGTGLAADVVRRRWEL